MHSRLEEIRENGLLRIANAESVEALQNVRRELTEPWEA